VKPQARVLVSHCHSNTCIGVVLRGADVDGAVSGRDCSELCSEAKRRGYLGELRYHAGACACGLPRASTPWAEALLLTLAHSLPLWLATYERLAGRSNHIYPPRGPSRREEVREPGTGGGAREGAG